MTLQQLSTLPSWITRLAWSIITILAAYLVGRFVTRTVCSRLSVWAQKTVWKWDELVIGALQREIPTWSLLAGLYIAVGF